MLLHFAMNNERKELSLAVISEERQILLGLSVLCLLDGHRLIPHKNISKITKNQKKCGRPDLIIFDTAVTLPEETEKAIVKFQDGRDIPTIALIDEEDRDWAGKLQKKKYCSHS